MKDSIRTWALSAAALIASLCLGLFGCGKSAVLPTSDIASTAEESASSAEIGALSEEAESADDTAAGEVSVRVASLDEYDHLIASHQGKVVLVDFWATWCPPCKMQFPHTVKLGKDHAGEGLAVVSVSLDDPTDESKDAVLTFLTKQNASIDNLISEYGAGVEAFEKFAIEGGAIPFYKLYDRQGKLRHQFTGNPEDIPGMEPIESIDDRVQELLAEQES